MKRSLKSSNGVTLLEIMLVLAVAAMVIVMSIRYYRNVNNSQRSNDAYALINAISGAADSIAGGQAAAWTSGNLSTATIAPMVGPANATTITSPTGGTVTVSYASASTYSVSMVLDGSTCGTVAALANQNPKINNSASCSGGTLTYTYDARL